MPLFKIFNRLFGETDKNELNETFIYLMRVAEEDKGVRSRLLKILTQASQDRKRSILNLVKDLKAQKAPKDFIEAMSYLADDAIAETALKKIRTIAD